MLGVLLVVTEGQLAELAPSEWRLGDFLTLLGLVAWTVYTVYGKRLIATVPPALATTGGHPAADAAAAAAVARRMARARVPRGARRDRAPLVVRRGGARGAE